MLHIHLIFHSERKRGKGKGKGKDEESSRREDWRREVLAKRKVEKRSEVDRFLSKMDGYIIQFIKKKSLNKLKC